MTLAAQRTTGDVIPTDRDLNVYVHPDAVMTVPKPDWIWQLCHTRPEPDRGTQCDDRRLVVSSLESYLYLIRECTKEEAWHRIKVMRAALRSHGEQDRGSNGSEG